MDIWGSYNLLFNICMQQYLNETCVYVVVVCVCVYRFGSLPLIQRSTCTYQSLRNVLKQRFGSNDNHANFKAQLDALRLGQDDSVAEFSSEAEFLV